MTGERTGVLETAIVIDDCPEDAEILRRYLRKALGTDVNVKHFSD
ncbi:MAG: hypothetical protein V2A76_06665 [Planctomycetota bacterium]